MCFSSTASFSASAVLLIVGAVAVRKSQNIPQRILACIPVIFSAQQFCEGMLWLALMHPVYAHWRWPATYAFLIFAQVVWPCYIPLAVMLLEKEPVRKKILSWLFSAGILLGAYLAWCLVIYHAHASVDGHHIRYTIDFPGANKWYSGIFYLIPTVVSPFISSIKRVRWLGVLIILSYLISRLLYQYYVISVWCFFATLISLVALAVIMQLRKETMTPVAEA